jgi:putative ABC transport system permease protein
MNLLTQDLHYAIRQLRKSPGFTLTAVLTLALGIGANTAIFSAVYAFLLRSLPYPNANRIAAIEDVNHKGATPGLSGGPRYFDLEQQVQGDPRGPIEHAAFYVNVNPTLIIDGHAPEKMTGARGSGEFFTIFGTQPLLGRVFGPQDANRKAEPVAVLSYAAWPRSFGGDPSVIGKKVVVAELPTTIIGVMPRGFAYPDSTIDLWLPATMNANTFGGYRGDGVRYFHILALMRPGVAPSGLQSSLDVLSARLAKQYPSTDADWGFTTSSLRDDLYGDLKPALLALMVAAFCVLLIACVNIANLLLARAVTRQREVALRRSLGATGMRIARQFLTESVLLSFAGGAAGILLADSLLRIFSSHLPANLSFRQTSVRLDWRVLLFAAGTAMTTAIFFGLMPTIQNARLDLNQVLKRGEARTGGHSGPDVRNAFIALQVCLSLALLVCAGLLGETLWKLQKTPLGFVADHAITFDTTLAFGTKKDVVRNFYAEFERRIAAIPGVTAVGQVSAPVMTPWSSRVTFDIDGRSRTPHNDTVDAESRNIYGDYLRAMGIPLLAGRAFREQDSADKAPGVVLINQQLAHQYFGGDNPIGRRLITAADSLALARGQGDESDEIIGVVGDVRGTDGSLAAPVLPEVYYPSTGLWPGMNFVVRSQGDPAALTNSIRETLRSIDPTRAMGKVRTLDETVDRSLAQPRLNTLLLAGFATVALILACIGIYGVIAYSVTQRTQEIGVRMALGASRQQVTVLFLLRAGKWAAVGGACGLGLSVALGNVLRAQLYGVQPGSATIYLFATMVLLVPVLFASYWPARRAARVEPVQALRSE